VDRFVVISGCSSSGKSTLIAELGKRGYAVVDEPGRRIVKGELARGGSALPWVDGVAFARRAMAIALADRAAAGSLDGWDIAEYLATELSDSMPVGLATASARRPA
jgi:predicted ATPase